MKNDLANLRSPFLDEELVDGEAPRSWDPGQLSRHTDDEGAFDRLATEEADLITAGEEGDDEFEVQEQEQEEDELVQHECHEGCAHDREALADEPEWWAGENETTESEHEEAGEDEGEDEEGPACCDEHAPEAVELFDGETWRHSAEQQRFRERVLAAHLARSRRSRGAPQRDLDPGERSSVPGTGIEMRSDAAAAAGRLLAAANADLATAQQAGDADARRTVRLSAGSGYRNRDHQKRLWLSYFPGYYARTMAAREALGGGPHSDDAVAYLLKSRRAGGFGLTGRIAAPGYSNHQNGIAIDFVQERRPGHRVVNRSDDASRAKWRRSWFHGWLRSRAAEFGFQPLATEEWHWEFRAEAASRGTAAPTPTPSPTQAPAPAPAPRPAGDTAPSPVATGGTPATAYLGGKLWTFQASTLPLPVAVFCPPAASGRGEVDVLLYAHGLLNGCERPRSLPDGLITGSPFRLGAAVAASNRPIVLVVPLLDWNQPGGRKAFGPAHPRWHALAQPAHLNAVVAQVLSELARVQSSRPPALGRLVIAGHSRAYDFLEPLAHLHADAQMQQGALARLSEVWSLDATYAGSPSRWQAWLAAHPQLRASVFYRPGTRTAAIGDAFYKARSEALNVVRVTEGHCAVPARRLPGLLAGERVAERREWEDGDDEFAEHDFIDEAGFIDDNDNDNDNDDGEAEADAEAVADAELDDLLGDDAWTPDDELEADEPAHESTDAFSDDELADDEFADNETVAFDLERLSTEDDEATLDAETLEAEGEFGDEEHAEQALEEDEAGDKAPMAIPADNPVPFAPTPPAGSHWPVRTRHPSARLVSYMYQAPSGIVGRTGRMFLAARTGKVGGRTVGRWHAGVDLFAHVNDVAVACEAGTIVSFTPFYKARSGQETYKLLIAHEGSGIVINYGELRRDSLSHHGLKVGARVEAGQPIGFVSDTSMLHFETYVAGTTDSHRWWKSEKTPPRQLLNPTRYLLALAQAGGSTHAPAPAPAPGPAPAPTSGKSPAELVRFAQRVLNACEGERLADDGDLGAKTRAALLRFRQKYALGAGAVLDSTTVLGLAQRALEELKQQSMFAQTGVLDARTRQELAAFRSQRGLGTDARLDAATRLALTQALARAGTGGRGAPAPSTSPPPANPPTPSPAPCPPSGRLPALPGLGAGHTPPSDPAAYRTFRLTTYHVVDQHDEPTGAVRIPILDAHGRTIAECSPSFFAKLSLEGTGRLTDGRLVNVTGGTVPVSHAAYEPVLAHHRRAYAKGDRKRAEQGKAPAPTTWSGLVTSGGRVVRALAFHEVPAAKRGVGYGTARGIAYTPFRTLAADIGTPKYAKVDPRWKGKGGLVPAGTQVYIKEYDGLALPDGSTHDGWFVVNDTGGAIFGAHFDVFTGTDALRRQARLPAMGQVWFPGIEQRIPAGYTYGLDK